MTISSEINRSGPYSGDGVTTDFEYKFKILEPQHLQVIRTDVSGTDSILSLDADYTVTGVGNDGGGSAIISLAPAEGSRITLLLDVPFTQETDLENQGAYYAETVEQALDLVVMRLQQLKERAARAVTIPPSFDSATIDKLIADILALSNKGDALEAVAAVSQYLETVAGISDDIEAVAGLTQTTVQKAAEAAQSATSANASAGLATAYATNPEDIPVPGSGGLFSAFHWYRKTLAIYNTVANTLAGWLHAAPAKTDIVDGDEFAIADSAAGWGLKKVLAGSIVRYIALALGLDFMVGFIPAWAGAASITIGPGIGFFGGKRHSTAVDTTRQLSATFGIGTGFLDTGVVQASRTYFIYAVRSLTTGSTDFIASLSATSATVNLPAGWEILSGSRIGCVVTNASAQIYSFVQEGNKVRMAASIIFTTTGNIQGLIVCPATPVGLSVDAFICVEAAAVNVSTDAAIVASDASGGGAGGPWASVRARARTGNDYPDASLSDFGLCRTNSSAQIHRYTDGVGSFSLACYVGGWIDWQCKRLWA